jgi:hypothetical protein
MSDLHNIGYVSRKREIPAEGSILKGSSQGVLTGASRKVSNNRN